MARSEVDGERRPQRCERERRLATGFVEEIPEPLGGSSATVERTLSRRGQFVVTEGGQDFGQQRAVDHPARLGDRIDHRLLATGEPYREAVDRRRIRVHLREPGSGEAHRPDDRSAKLDRPTNGRQDDRDGGHWLIDEAVDRQGSVGRHVVIDLGEDPACTGDGRRLAHGVNDDIEATLESPDPTRRWVR